MPNSFGQVDRIGYRDVVWLKLYCKCMSDRPCPVPHRTVIWETGEYRILTADEVEVLKENHSCR
jgi:hypothetical protein